jgi:cytochrome oxidase Cu insertion factor (SCO1/SenC/PrrC family)
MKIVALLHVLLAASIGLLAYLAMQAREGGAGRSGVIEAPGSLSRSLPFSTGSRTEQEILTFQDHTGRAVSEADFHGSYLLVFFGYTSCPDVCPGNLAAISSVMRSLGELGDRVRPIFISFDPKRDTAEVLADYIGHFDDRIVGLTGSEEEIAAAARAYGVFYEVADIEDAEGAQPGGYLIDHTSQTYLVGPEGEGIMVFRHGTDPELMAGAIRGVLTEELLPVAWGEES